MYKWAELYVLYMQVAEKYGSIAVKYAKKTTSFGRSDRTYYIEYVGEQEPVEIGDGKDGKKLARTLAAALDSAGVTGYNQILPPEFGPAKHSDTDEWELWAGDSRAIPARIATAGKAAMAGWLKVVHQEREKWIGNELGVSEGTVRQYLSDLREGRR